MMEIYEQWIILRYLESILKGDISTGTLNALCDFMERNLPFLGMEDQDEATLELLEDFQSAVRENKGRKLHRTTRKVVLEALRSKRKELGKPAPGQLETNLKALSRELELDPLESHIFGLVIRYKLHRPLSHFLDDLTQEHLGTLELCARCLDADPARIAERLRPIGRLFTSGILVLEKRTGNDLDDFLNVPEIILHSINRTLTNQDDARKYILGEPVCADLKWDDFDHLGETRDRLAAFLQKVVNKQVPGINILLWGPPGTGKTEFCKTLAAYLNLNLYSLDQMNDTGEEPTRQERIGAFRLSQNLLRCTKNSLLLFDEMDDLFEFSGFAALFGGKLSSNSKVFTNRLLENNPVPTLWTINDPSCLDESIIRRMALAIEMKVPPASARQNVWSRLLEKSAIDVPKEEITQLAKMEISPAVASNAIRFAELVGSNLEDFQFATHGIIHAIKGKRPFAASSKSSSFLPELVRTDVDLSDLTRRLKESGRQDFSLCLYGPPGTGKSAYVRYLAKNMGMPVLFKRASDLFSKWVGESEQNIARCFQEARDKEAFLVFDEADSLLGDRTFAQASWEVSQVNEMLTWMESHPLPFACTTNLKNRLDPASLRRFSFKCYFDYLSAEQVQTAFEHFFRIPLEDETAPLLRNLTPGDFEVVRKKASFLGSIKDRSALVQMLKDEMEAKPEKASGSIGFAPAKTPTVSMQ